MMERPGFAANEKNNMLLSYETRYGIEVTGELHLVLLHNSCYKFTCACVFFHSTVRSFIEIINIAFTIPGVDVFLSERLCQDPLESFFGCQRQRGGTSENPNVLEFCKNTQALRVINSVYGSIPRGNCRKSKQGPDMQKESMPLPKRKRYHK